MLSDSGNKEHPSFVSNFNGYAFSCYTFKYDAGLWLEIYHIKKIFVCYCFSKMVIITYSSYFPNSFNSY